MGNTAILGLIKDNRAATSEDLASLKDFVMSDNHKDNDKDKLNDNIEAIEILTVYKNVIASDKE